MMQSRDQRTIVDGVDFERVFKFPSIFVAIASSMQPSRLLIGFVMVIVLMATGRLWDSFAPGLSVPLGSSLEESILHEQRKVAVAESGTTLGQTAPENVQQWSVQEAQAHLLEAWSSHKEGGSFSQEELIEFEQLYRLLESLRPLGPFESSASYVSTEWNKIVDGALNLDAVGAWRGLVAIDLHWLVLW